MATELSYTYLCQWHTLQSTANRLRNNGQKVVLINGDCCRVSRIMTANCFQARQKLLQTVNRVLQQPISKRTLRSKGICKRIMLFTKLHAGNALANTNNGLSTTGNIIWPGSSISAYTITHLKTEPFACAASPKSTQLGHRSLERQTFTPTTVCA